ncbi:MAG: AraC family transcriptional regulator [Lachnospiraceae bacterium]|nr:AraC family transcriptional regulator [Lachnospiraceae bacterium]
MKNGYELETFDSATPYNIRLTQIKKFNLHWHSYIEVYYAKKGSIRLQTGDYSFRLDEGHICFIDSNTIHSVNRIDSDNRVMILQIPIDKGKPFYSLKQYKFNSTAYLADFSKDLAPLEELQNLMENMYKESQLKISGYNQVILGYINTFFGLLIRRYYLIEKKEEDYIAENNLNRLSEIIEYLDEHYTDKLSLKQLSEELHMNYYYLSHFFKDTAGISFQDYLNNLRIDKSLSLLTESNMSITDIALNTGFPNIKAYTTAFQKKFGVLPSVYRKAAASNTDINSLSDEQLVEEIIDATSYGKELSATDIYNKLSITPKDKRFFTLDYYITSPHSSGTIESTSSLIVHEDALLSISTEHLEHVIKDLSPEVVKFCCDIDSSDESLHESPDGLNDTLGSVPHYEPGNVFHSEKSPLIQKLSMAKGMTSRIETINNWSRISNDRQGFIFSYSMLGAISHVIDFLGNPLSSHDTVMKEITGSDVPNAFSFSNTCITNFGCPSPYFYADLFIKKLKGILVFKSESCVIFYDDSIYRILCCHKKSLQMYQSLIGAKEFNKEDYLFFTGSYPHMRYSFSFGQVNTGFTQTTYTLSEESGSVFSNWCKMGAPDMLNFETASYLTAVSKPNISISHPPFRDKPIISTELPALGIAYMELIPD